MFARRHQRRSIIAAPLVMLLAFGAVSCASHQPTHQPEVRTCSDLVTAAPISEPYRFKAGDTLRVSIRTAPELNAERIIAPDGSVSLPLVGHIAAAGHTSEELQASLEDLYAPELRDPSLQIAAVAFGEQGFGKRVRRCTATALRS